MTEKLFGRPFLKRFAYAIGPLSVLSICHVCDTDWCIVAKRLDGSRLNLALR